MEWFEEGTCYHSALNESSSQTFAYKEGMIRVETFSDNHCGHGVSQAFRPPDTCFADRHGNEYYSREKIPHGSAVVPGTTITIGLYSGNYCNSPGGETVSFQSGICRQNDIPNSEGQYVLVEGFQTFGFIRYSTFDHSDCSGGYVQRRFYNTDSCIPGESDYIIWSISSS